MPKRDAIETCPNRMSDNKSPSQLRLRELRFGDAFAHGSGGGDTSSDGFHEFVHVVGTTPLLFHVDKYVSGKNMKLTYPLVCQDIATDVPLLTLNGFHIGLHSLCRVGPRKEVTNICGRMQSSQLRKRSQTPFPDETRTT